MKIRYEVDPHNRLIAARTKKESTIPRYREVLEGRFSIGKDNSLYYHLKKSSNIDLPQQIKFSGSWSLDKQRNLVLTLDKWNNQCQGDKLVIGCNIISAKAGELAFSVMTRKGEDKSEFYILKLSGLWQADEYNRLCFNAEKEKGSPDRLTLEAGWEVDRKNKLTYSYTRKDLRRKKQIIQSVSFQGYWAIADKRRLSYVMSSSLHSQFDFQASFEKPLQNAIQYRIGMGLAAKDKSVKIFGSWKINERLGVSFEAQGDEERNRAILFSASYKIDSRDNLEVCFRNRLNQDLGLEAKISRRFFGEQGEAFIRALVSEKEKGVSAGVGLRW